MDKNKSINEKALDNILSITSRVSTKISENLTGKKPFARQQMNPDDLVFARQTISNLDVQDLIQEYGLQKVLELFHEIDGMTKRRAKNGTIVIPETGSPSNVEQSQQTIQGSASPIIPQAPQTQTQQSPQNILGLGV